MKHLVNFTDLTENYSLYLESDDMELVNDYSQEDDELENDNSEEDENEEELHENKKSGVTASLRKKSKASGIPMGILRKVFAKGMQAWNAGHRPGVAQHQWGMGRVN